MIKKKPVSAKNASGSEFQKIYVLIERLDAKVDLIVDGYAATNKKLDDFRIEVNERFIEIYDKFEIVFDELRDIRKELKSVKI
jgi:hypothetical protein